MSADLEGRLRALGRELEWPATPDIAGAAVTPPRLARWRRRRLVAALAAALLLLPAAGAVAFTDVLEWLGVSVRRAPELPREARRPALADLGQRVSLAEAGRRAGFRPVVPPALGPPEQVRVRGDVVTLVYDGGTTLLAQLPGRLGAELVEKVVRGDTDVRRVPGGIFISGPEHSYLYRARGGGIAEDRPFLAAETLVVQRGGLLLRLERRGLTADRALALLR